MTVPKTLRTLRNIILRLLYGAVSLLFIIFITFIADEMVPGDAATILAGDKATEAQVIRLRKAMGLDRAWPVRFVEYVGEISHGDFGKSYRAPYEPVVDIVKRDLPMTAKIAGCAILLASAIGLVLGTFAALNENRATDRVALSLSTLGVTLPNFVLAPLLVLVFVEWLDYLPLRWQVPELQVAPQIYYLILPVVVMAARPVAMLTRLTRASMLDTLQQEFVRLGIAKGVPAFRLYLVHALRNAILPVLTGIGTSFGYLLTGSFIVERFFLLPGLGREAIEAIQQRNTPVIMACVIVTGAMFIVINLVVDIVQQLVDPRIRESQI